MEDRAERIRVKKVELDRLRPVAGCGFEVLSSWYDVELTYSSNAIEGNTLTQNEIGFQAHERLISIYSFSDGMADWAIVDEFPTFEERISSREYRA